jgi:hypothetical protein
VLYPGGDRWFSLFTSVRKSDLKPDSGVGDEDLAHPYIAVERRYRAMPGLLHDHEFADAIHRGLGDHAGAKAMPREWFGLHAGTRGGPLQYRSNGVAIKSTLRYLPMPVHSSEDETVGEPRPQGANRTRNLVLTERESHPAAGAFLVGL